MSNRLTKRKISTKGNQDWIAYVRLYQEKTGLTWLESMRQAGKSYRKEQINRIIQGETEQEQKKNKRNKYQKGGALFDNLLGSNQIQKLVNYGIQLMGESKFFGLDTKTVGNLVNLVIETGKSTSNLKEMLTLIQQNPFANQISQIPFTAGPAGVKDAMQAIIEAIDKEPNGSDIYSALCAIYKTVLIKSSTIFIKIIGTLTQSSSKANNQNRIVRAIQGLNYDALTNEYNGLPSLVKQLLEDPNSLQTIITQVMGVLSQSNRNLGQFVQNNLYPVVNSTIEAVRKVLPITFATIILLERCGGLPAEEIEQLNKLIDGTAAIAIATSMTEATIAPSVSNEIANQDKIMGLEQLRQLQLQQQEELIKQQAEQLRQLQEYQALQQRQLVQVGGRRRQK